MSTKCFFPLPQVTNNHCYCHRHRPRNQNLPKILTTVWSTPIALSNRNRTPTLSLRCIFGFSSDLLRLWWRTQPNNLKSRRTCILCGLFLQKMWLSESRLWWAASDPSSGGPNSSHTSPSLGQSLSPETTPSSNSAPLARGVRLIKPPSIMWPLEPSSTSAFFS